MFEGVLTLLFNQIFPDASYITTINFLLGIINNGLVPVIITLVAMLPQVVIMFACIEILKACKIIQSTSPVLLGFGCTTIAYASKDPISKPTAVLLAFIPCAAKMPVVMVMSLIFDFWLIYLIYVLSVSMGLLSYWLLSKKFPTKKNHATCTPRKVSWHDIPLDVLQNSLKFLKRILGPVLVASVVLYFVSNFTPTLRSTNDITQSIIYNAMAIFAPLFTPIGINHAMFLVALLFGLLAKELAIASFSAFVIVGSLDVIFTVQSIYSFFVFFMLYPLCLPAFTALARRFGHRFAWVVAGINFFVAYLFAGLFFWIFSIM